MNIDLNELKQDKNLSKDYILNTLTQEEIYSYYIGSSDLHINKVMCSPIREDKKPSFGLFYTDQGKLLWNDFAIGCGDVFDFVSAKTGESNFYNVLKLIEEDLIFKKNNNYEKVLNKVKIIKKETSIVKLGVKIRNWNKDDFDYWQQYNIKLKTLERYRVKPISMMFINKKPVKVNRLAYCYFELKDKKLSYKIYQPFSNYKWFSNNDSSVWQGWSQAKINKGGDVLIITKSLKDVMSIISSTEFNSISLQSESTMPKEKIINLLKRKFKKIYLLYDNDYDKEMNHGQNFAKKIIERYNLTNICISDRLKSKDFSDLVKNKGVQLASDFLKKEINNLKPF